MAGCRSATKLYDKGNYDESVQVAVKKLQKDPNDAKLQSVIKDAYKYAVADHENRIRNYEGNTSELKDEWIYNEYAGLQNLYNAIFKAPTAFELVKPTNYSDQLNEYGDRAADVHYQHGMGYMQHGDKESFKMAYHEFQTASQFKVGDQAIGQAMGDAYEAALTRVVVLPIDEFGYRYSSYSGEMKSFNDEIIRNFQSGSNNEFVHFFSARDAQGRGIIADEIVEMRFSTLEIGKVQDNNSVREISKEVVTKETVYKPDSVVKQTATVKAKITTTKRTIFSQGNLKISVRDAAGHYLWNDDIRGTHTWSTEFTAYTGDERALSEDDKKLCGKKMEAAPQEDFIMRNIKQSILNDCISRVRGYYNHY
jgi:hypothetical protein